MKQKLALEDVDAALKAMWDDFKVQPTKIWMYPDEARNIFKSHGIVYTDEEWQRFLDEHTDENRIVVLTENQWQRALTRK